MKIKEAYIVKNSDLFEDNELVNPYPTIGTALDAAWGKNMDIIVRLEDGSLKYWERSAVWRNVGSSEQRERNRQSIEARKRRMAARMKETYK